VPQRRLNTARLIQDLLRLRRAAGFAGERARAEIDDVQNHLHELVGPTVSRAEAARLLGISYPALDRWISKGEIPAVITPEGRREIPVSHLLDLLEEIEERQEEDLSADLASVMRDRRRRANAITDDELLPPSLRNRPKPRRHRAADLSGLLYHRLVAQRLDDALVDDARERLRRWRKEDRIHPLWADEWEEVLAQSLPKIAKGITSDSQRGRELRQTSPFAGVLTEQERRRVNRTAERLAVS
jgi:excisionase family DNA binding protein